ncbi:MULTISPECIES: tetratricopeptide repeat protein [Flammeovirga]|uniref:Tetratricopeptide repeat protein n=1 Tax=Flammeovirga agarivorans TaxID=2726742 RepID=A0A7X8SJI4_9BACT|nr:MULTISPECIES: tetratricopeptide repeat protein [Flammeovirga]NLR91302.1 tetratricopeptide repeat protein [Flammeovirga agarivorans]
MTRTLLYKILLTSTLTFFTLNAAFSQESKALEHFVEAENLRKGNKLIEAIDEYTLAIKYDSMQEQYYLMKAKCQVSVNQFNNAINTFEQALEFFPENGFMNYQLARLYMRKDYYDEAIEYYDQAYKHLSNSNKSQRINSKNQIIMILFKEEEYDKIRPHINDVLSLSDNNYIALYYSGKLHNMNGEYEKAVEDIKQALNFTPNNNSQTARFYYELGYAYYNLEEYQLLNSVIEKANYGSYRKLVAKLTPEYKYWIAMCYYQIYDFDKSTNLLFDALKQDHSNVKAHELQIRIAEVTSDKSEQIDKAYMMIDNLQDKHRKSKIYEDIANWQLSSQLYDESVESCDSALILDEYNYNVKYTKAVALFKMNKLQESIDVLNELVNYNGLDVKTKAKYHFTLGIAAMKNEKVDLAINSFKSAKLDKNFKIAADDALTYLDTKKDSI